jgi:type IV secretory pathway TraG/TraD family ATPase VirD4
MTRDVAVLQQYIRIVVVIAAICTTSVPIIYAFSRWYKSLLGQLFMLQSVSFAAAMDLTTVFMYWKPKDILIVFWADVLVLTGIAVSTLLLAVLIFTMNHPRSKGKHHRDH